MAEYYYKNSKEQGKRAGKPSIGWYDLDGKKINNQEELDKIKEKCPYPKHGDYVEIEYLKDVRNYSLELDRDFLRAKSINALVGILNNGKTDGVIVQAARELLDRIDGKPYQAPTTVVQVDNRRLEMQQSVKSKILATMTREQIEAILNED